MTKGTALCICTGIGLRIYTCKALTCAYAQLKPRSRFKMDQKFVIEGRILPDNLISFNLMFYYIMLGVTGSVG